MSNVNISSGDSEIILRKMCEMIGLSYEAVLFIKPNWFELHNWTPEEEQKFIDWLADFLIHRSYVNNKDRALREARKLNIRYGWKTVSKK